MMRTECMVCDGCGKHDEINQFDARNYVMRVMDYLPEGWVAMRWSNQTRAFCTLACAAGYVAREGDQLGLFS